MAEENKEDPCENMCAEQLKGPGGSIVHCEKTREELSKSCFLPRVLEEKFYDYVPPKKMEKESLLKMFDEFAMKITEDNAVKSIYHKIFADSKSKPQIKCKYLTNDNHTHCDDIIVKFYIEKMIKGGGTKNIFHIALHSRFPVYKRGKRRALSGCGFYEKKVDEEHDGSGAFHYKIENLKWTKSGVELRSDQIPQPYKKFNINRDYSYRFNADHSDFHLDNKEIIQAFYKSKKEELTDETFQEGIKMHKLIYDLFVPFWNKYVTEDISTVNTPTNSLKHNIAKLLSETNVLHTSRKSHGGKRRTLRLISKRGKTMRRK